MIFYYIDKLCIYLLLAFFRSHAHNSIIYLCNTNPGNGVSAFQLHLAYHHIKTRQYTKIVVSWTNYSSLKKKFSASRGKIKKLNLWYKATVLLAKIQSFFPTSWCYHNYVWLRVIDDMLLNTLTHNTSFVGWAGISWYRCSGPYEVGVWLSDDSQFPDVLPLRCHGQ